MTETSSEVKVTTIDGKTASGTINLVWFPPPVRWRKAAIRLGVCWLLAIVTVVVPLAHFFTVPGFFIAGPVLAYLALNRESMILGGQATCPECQKQFSIQPSAEKWPLDETCDHCRATLKLTKA